MAGKGEEPLNCPAVSVERHVNNNNNRNNQQLCHVPANTHTTHSTKLLRPCAPASAEGGTTAGGAMGGRRRAGSAG